MRRHRSQVRPSWASIITPSWAMGVAPPLSRTKRALFTVPERPVHIMVYSCAAMRTIIDLDEDLVAEAMARYGLRTKRDAVNFALKQLVGEPLAVADALAL